MTKNFLAIDLGATSGRTILATVGNGALEMTEIARFPNNIVRQDNHCYWDFEGLFGHIIDSLRTIAASGTPIESIGIDTWGVDVVFFGEDGSPVDKPFCYRDTHTDGAPERFFERIPRNKVYDATGIQVMNFNTLFQLNTLRYNKYPYLHSAHKILFMPDAISYMLTGVAVTEATIASTSQMCDARQGAFSPMLLEAVGLTENQFGKWVMPGEIIGTLSNDVQKATGLGAIPVIAVAGHDTASAVAAVPAKCSNFAYLSSGTWSLMGIESPSPIITEASSNLNFTNEGGVDGTTRFLKNICGMWLLERCRAEWKEAGNDFSYSHLIQSALAATPFRSLVNPDDKCFANPDSMLTAIREYCRNSGQAIPETEGEITRCIFESLALRYRQVMDMIRSMSDTNIEVLHIIGGGSRNALLNQFTANALNMRVEAGPAEATAIGNIMLQARAAGIIDTLPEMRALISSVIPTEVFMPEDTEKWESAYNTFKIITQ